VVSFLEVLSIGGRYRVAMLGRGRRRCQRRRARASVLRAPRHVVPQQRRPSAGARAAIALAGPAEV